MSAAATQVPTPAAESKSQKAPTTMCVRKRNGTLEPVDINKIVRAVGRCCAGLAQVDAMQIATKTIGGLYEGATTKELDVLSINTAASLIVEEPEYSRLAARLLATYIDKAVANQEIHSFSQSISAGHKAGLIADRVADFVAGNSKVTRGYAHGVPKRLRDAVNSLEEGKLVILESAPTSRQVAREEQSNR